MMKNALFDDAPTNPFTVVEFVRRVVAVGPTQKVPFCYVHNNEHTQQTVMCIRHTGIICQEEIKCSRIVVITKQLIMGRYNVTFHHSLIQS